MLTLHEGVVVKISLNVMINVQVSIYKGLYLEVGKVQSVSVHLDP